MTAKPIVPRAQARSDIDAAIEDYLREAGARTALGFIDRVETALHAIAHRPAAGSSRYANELDIPGLRSQRLKRYPFLVFYVEREDHIDIWRVLHAKRDIPAWVGEPEAS